MEKRIKIHYSKFGSNQWSFSAFPKLFHPMLNICLTKIKILASTVRCHTHKKSVATATFRKELILPGTNIIAGFVDVNLFLKILTVCKKQSKNMSNLLRL